MTRRIVAALMALALLAVAAPVATADSPTPTASTSTTVLADSTNTTNTTATDTTVSALIGGARLYLDPAGSLVDLGSDADALSLYNAGLTTDAQANGYFDLYHNLIQDTDKVAFMRMQQSVFWSVQNETAQSVAKTNAKERVKRYYTVHEKNLLDRWNLMLAGYESYSNQAGSVGYDMFSAEATTSNYVDDQDGNANELVYQLSSVTPVSTGNTTYTLVNGSTKQVRTLTLEVTGDMMLSVNNDVRDTETTTITISPSNVDEYSNTHTVTDDGYQVSADIAFSQIGLNSPSNDYDNRNYLSATRFDEHLKKIDEQTTEITSSADNYVTGVYSDLEAGTLNVTDALGEINTVFNYLPEASGENTSFNKGSGYLAAAGFDSVSYKNTSYMNVTYQPQFDPDRNLTREGFLLSRNAPEGGWTYGKTYNQTNLNGTQMFATVEGDEHIIAGDFTIHAAYDQDGNQIDNTTISQPTEESYKVTNTSELQSQIVALSETIEEINDRTTDDSGAGAPGSGSGGGIIQQMMDAVGLASLSTREMGIIAGSLVLAVFVVAALANAVTPG